MTERERLLADLGRLAQLAYGLAGVLEVGDVPGVDVGDLAETVRASVQAVEAAVDLVAGQADPAALAG